MRRIIDASGVAPTLFPALDLTKLIEYIRDVWQEMKIVCPKWWTARKETDIVAGFLLALSVDQRVVTSGVGFGHFILEQQIVKIAANGMPKLVGRTDIQFVHASTLGPILTMEFKRLNNKSVLRQAYFVSGVSRFVSGKYSKDCDFAMMIGMVEGGLASEKAGLIKYLSRPSAVLSLGLLPLSHPCYGEPSSHAPHTAFDTLHKRALGCLTPTIHVVHMLLER